jgi:hypothetical protein
VGWGCVVTRAPVHPCTTLCARTPHARVASRLHHMPATPRAQLKDPPCKRPGRPTALGPQLQAPTPQLIPAPASL